MKTRLTKGDHFRVVLIALISGAIGAAAPAVAHGVKHALFAHEAGTAAKADNAKKLDGKSFAAVYNAVTTADISVKADSDDQVLSPGEQAVVKIQLKNHGPADALRVSMSMSRDNWGSVGVLPPGCTTDGTYYIDCLVSRLRAGKTKTLEFTFDQSDCTQNVNPSIASWQFDPKRSNNSDELEFGCPES